MARKILVIDDDDGILEAFGAMLESTDYEAILSSDAEYLQTMTKQQHPDLILLDVLLSGQDGRKICQRLKANKRTQHIPVIMMSAAPVVEKTVKEQACADGFLRKPFEIEEVLQIINTFVK